MDGECLWIINFRDGTVLDLRAYSVTTCCVSLIIVRLEIQARSAAETTYLKLCGFAFDLGWPMARSLTMAGRVWGVGVASIFTRLMRLGTYKAIARV
jgi:hypothetical protein